MTKIWRPRETTVRIVDADSVTIDSSATLPVAFAAATPTAAIDITASMKNVTIVDPVGDTEKVDLLGVDANSFQNAELDRKPFDLATVSGTLVVDSGEVLETLAYGAGVAITPGTHTRYQAGDGNRPDIAVLVELDDGTYEVSFCLDNAYITKIGDTRLSAADGHWEIDFEAKCLPRDFYREYKD